MGRGIAAQAISLIHRLVSIIGSDELGRKAGGSISLGKEYGSGHTAPTCCFSALHTQANRYELKCRLTGIPPDGARNPSPVLSLHLFLGYFRT